MQQLMFILGELSDDDVDWIIQTSQREEIPPAKVLIQKGTPLDRLYLLLEGQLRVTIEGKQIALLNSGEIFGEMSFINAELPVATVETVQTVNKCVVLSIAHDALREKLRQDVRFEANFYRALAMFLSERLRMADHQLSSLGYEIRQTSPHLPPNDAEPELLERYYLAKTRYDWLLSRLRGDVENFAIDTPANF
jgi:CRP-like cAMP-binding protein